MSFVVGADWLCSCLCSFSMPTMIDRDTPDSAMTRVGFDGEAYELVFSDEFETEVYTVLLASLSLCANSLPPGPHVLPRRRPVLGSRRPLVRCYW